MVFLGQKIGFKDILSLVLIAALLLAIPLAVTLIKKQQTFKGQASTDVLSSCPNRLTFGLNGPVSEKIKQLFTVPSLRFIPIGWGEIQPNQDSAYDFTKTDNYINWAIADGQTPTVKFCDGDCFPNWARQMDQEVDKAYCCSTDYVCRVLKDDTVIVDAFKQVVGAMVLRYKDKVQYWDYGIEPNCRGYNPARYTQWLKYFYEAVKSADPKAIVIGGHLAGANTDYLAAMYANGAKPYFDRLALDPYGEPFDYTGLDRVRNLMVSQNDGDKKIWIGEWGLPTNNDETRQANLIQEGLNYLTTKPWIEAAFYHNFECELWTASCSPGSPGYLGFGLLRSDGSTKSAFDVFQKGVSACLAPPPTVTSSPTQTPTQVPLTPTPTKTPTPFPTKTPTPTQQPPTPTIKKTITLTPTPTSTPPPEQSKFDLSDDTKINSVDVAMFLDAWRNGQLYVAYDFNGDEVVNSMDYALLVKNLSQ